MDSMQDIIVIEPICVGKEHDRFNSVLLSSISLSETNANITFIAENLHTKIILQNSTKNTIRIQAHQVIKRCHKLGLRFDNFVHYFKTVLEARKYNGRLVFLSSNNWVLLLAKILCRGRKCIFILHSYADIYIKSLEQPTFLNKTFHRLIKDNCFQFILLRDDSVQYVRSIDKQKNYGFLNHPISKLVGPVHINNSHSIKIGFIGRSISQKGYCLFSELKSVYMSMDLRFLEVGPMVNEEAKKNDALLSDRLLFDNLISDLDLIFYASDGKSYLHSVSGVLFDALENQIPIIGIRDSFITYFEKTFGNIGFVFDTKYELMMFIEKISKIEISQCNIDYALIKKKLLYSSDNFIANLSLLLNHE